MSKNLTRKGIAFGALVALATSTFAGAPATAAVSDSIVTGLSLGTSYNSVVGYDNELTLATTLAPSNSSNAATLHYRISNPSGAKLQISAGQSGSVVRATAAGSDVNLWDTEASPAIIATDADTATAATGLQISATSFNVVPVSGATSQVGSSSVDNHLSISVADGDANVAVTVYAWLDSSSNASNIQADTELYGNSVTLNFYDQANVTAVSEVVAPVTGAASVEATFTTTPELNGQQLGADFIDGSWTTQGNANAVLAKYTDDDAATTTAGRGTTTYSGTTKKWTSKVYLAFAQANDAYNGTNLSKFSITTLSTTASVQHGTYTTFTDLDDIGLAAGATGYIANSNYETAATASSYRVIRKDVTVVSATSIKVASATGMTATDAVSRVARSTSYLEFWTAGTYSTVQASGIYSATPYIGTVKLGAAGSSTNSGITADDTKATIAVSDNVAAGYNWDASAASTVVVRTGTTSVAAKATIYYTDADTGVVKVAPAGIPVTGTIATPTGTFQINAAGVGETSDVEYTDANGQVTFTVTTTTASATDNSITLEIRPQSIAAANAAGAKFVLNWDDAAYTVVDLNDTYAQPNDNSSTYRRIATSGTYTYNFAVLDQWGKAADAAKYRLQVLNDGRTVSSNTYTLSNGRVSVAVADGAQGSGTTITTTVNLQKLVSDTWTTQASESWDGTGFGKVVINVADAATESISVGADGWTTFTATRSSNTVDLVDAIATKALEAQDRRVSAVTQPAYGNDVVVAGRVINKTTGVAQGGAVVTISGPSTILFSAGNVDALGSITVIADNNGYVNVRAYSTTAQEDAVITFTSASGATKTVKVTFSAVGALTGTKLTLSASAAQPGKTLVFTGKLTDKWGNAVKTSDATSRATLTVVYTGPGLLSGALPTETDADGVFTVRVLLGTSDTGSAVVKATYGAANGTISSADTGDNIDIVATATAVIGGAVVVAPAKANVVGKTKAFSVSVSGNASAKNVVVKVAGKTVATLKGSASAKTYTVKATKGSKKVTVYVGGKLIATKTVSVK
jgi:hypothetical protein